MKLAQLFSLYNRIRRERRTMCKTEAKRPRQHARAFVLESLENRVLLSATPVDVPTTEPVVTAAVVTTDKADYAPGETALITTSNTSADGLKFSEAEMVQFQVTRTDGIQDSPMGNVPWYVTDGVGGFKAYEEFDANGQVADWISPDNDGTVNGSISTDWFVEDQYLGASLLLTATGQASGAVATTAFTDAPKDTTTSVTSSSPTSTYGDSVKFTAVVTAGNGNGTGPTGSVAFFDGASLLGTASAADSDGSGTSTWSITTSSLNAGPHSSIHAIYSPTGNF